MTILEIKDILKQKKITYEKLAELSGIPLQTIQKIFAGITKNPRIDTVQAIENALGLDKETSTDLTNQEKDFLLAFRKLTEDEKKEFLSIADFILSKRQ